MPNVNSPVGFKPDKQGNGGLVRPNQYFIAGALASNIYRNSCVVPTGTSKQIDVAAATARIIGVFIGCNYVDAGGNTQFRPYWGSGQTIQANTLVEASVYDDPNMVFRVQVSGAAGLAASDVGALADLVIGTGSTLTGNSGDQLDQTTIGSGTVFRIEELYNGAEAYQSTYGQYAKALVRVSKHYLSGAMTGI